MHPLLLQIKITIKKIYKLINVISIIILILFVNS
jgi:hypothetical protein